MPGTPSTSGATSQLDTQSDSEGKVLTSKPATPPDEKKAAIDGGSGVFAAGGSTRHYRPIPEYEGMHRWDPAAEWTKKEEKMLVKKVGPLRSASTG